MPHELSRPRAASVGRRICLRLSSIPVWVLLFIVAVWTLPSIGLVVDSFRPGRGQQGFWTVATDPGQLTLGNYERVLTRSGMSSMFDSIISSFAIVIPATVIPIALAAFAAYCFAFMSFRGRDWIFVGTVSMMAIPFQLTLIPLLTSFVSGAHLTIPLTQRTLTVFPDLSLNTHGAIAAWLPLTGFAIPFSVFVLHNSIVSLPRDIIDSARIDGAGHATIFWRLVIPLSIPALSSLAILQFLWSWNDFLIPQTMTSGGDPVDLPSTVRLAHLAGTISSAGPVGSAAALVQVAIPLLVFFGLQRHIVRGLLVGSING